MEKQKRVRLTESQKNQILELFEQGLKPLQISNKLDIKPTTISGFLSRNGLKTNPQLGNPNYFDQIDTHSKAYILGFIAADGCITKSTSNKNYGLRIRLSIKDKEVIEFIKSELQSTHKILEFEHELNGSILVHAIWSVTNEHLSSSLINLGIVPNKSLIIQNIFNNIPKEFRKSAILGYFDGDGSIYHMKHNTTDYISIRGTEELLSGIISEIGLEIYKLHKPDTTYRLDFGSKSEIIKFKTIYENASFFLTRKFEKFNLKNSTLPSC